jgi:hypothetical protein
MRRRLAFVPAYAAALGERIAGRLTLLAARVAGQGLVEYGLILVLIMVVCVGILSMVGVTVSEVWYGKLIENGPFSGN